MKKFAAHFGVDFLHSTKDIQHDLTISFSWASFFKNPTSSTSCFGDPALAKLNQVISMSMCETCHQVCNQDTQYQDLGCMYLQEEPSTPPSGEPSGDTNETTNPDEFTQVNAHDTYRFQCNHEFTGIAVAAYLGKGSSNHSPGPMELFKA